jgi:hypothetical protein
MWLMVKLTTIEKAMSRGSQSLPLFIVGRLWHNITHRPYQLM